MWPSLIADAVLVAFVVLLGWAAISDCLTFTIPNRISLALLALYPGWVVATWPSVDPLGGLAVGIAVLIAGFIGFNAGVMGGGDAKLLAVVALWAGPPRVFEVLLVTSLAGGLLALPILVVLTLRRRTFTVTGGAVETGGSLWKQRTPYAVAIAMAGLYLAHRLMLE